MRVTHVCTALCFTSETRVLPQIAAFTRITLGIGALVAMQARVKAGTEELTGTLDEQTGALTKYSRASVVRRLEEGGEYEAARKAGVTQRELTDAVLKGGDALDSVQKRLGSRNTFGGMFTGASYEAGVAQLNIKNVAESVQDSQEAFRNQKAANEGSGQSAASVAEQYKQEAAQVSNLANELSDLVAQFDALNGVNQDAISANASYQEALAGLADQVAQQKESTKGYTTSLDENTAIGAGNASMLSDLANKAQEAASKQLDVDRSTMSAKDAAEKYAGTLAAQRRKFIESATAADFNAGEVKKLADRVFQLPSEKQIGILANTKQAQMDLDAFITRNDGRMISVRQQLIQEAVDAGASRGTANAAYKAAGGPIYGPGTANIRLKIPAMLSNGEYVVRASSVDRVGLRFLDALNDGSYTPPQVRGRRPGEADVRAGPTDGVRSYQRPRWERPAVGVVLVPVVRLAGAGHGQGDDALQDQGPRRPMSLPPSGEKAGGPGRLQPESPARLEDLCQPRHVVNTHCS